MAERRMFAKTIVDSDAFLDMPTSTQCLYFHLAMRADDDGFINNPRKIMRMVGASEDDARILLSKNFIIAFESGVVVIKHWRIHNIIRSDRHKETNYTEELEMLSVKENGAYTLATNCQPSDNQLTTKCQPSDNQLTTNCQPNDNQVTAQVRLGKNSIGKSNRVGRFTPPTLDEIREYCAERNNGIDPQRFFDYYEARGWELKKGQKVKNWQACVRTWERSGVTPSKPKRSEVTNDDRERIKRFLGGAE